MRASFVLSILAASVASLDALTPLDEGTGCEMIKTLEECCGKSDGRTNEYAGQECVPSKALDAPFSSGNVCEPKCFVENTCADTKPGVQTDKAGTCVATTPTPETTTVTPWDSSASSSADSDSLASVYSSSFKDDSSGSVGSSESSDSLGESSLTSSGSDASGSSGSNMFMWQWLLLALCCCAAAIAPLLKPSKKKPTPKPKGPAKTTLASDHPAGCTYLEVTSQAGFKAGQTIEIGAGTPTAEIRDVSGLGSILLTAPLMYPHPAGTEVVELKDPKVPVQTPVQPVATTSTVIPSYAMAAPTYVAPATTAYAAPATTAYAAAPVSYATQAYAAPATTAYAAQAYAAPGNVV